MHSVFNENFSILEDETGSTISGQAVIIARALESYSVDPGPFFSSFNITVPARTNAFVRFPARRMAEMWDRAAELSEDRWFTFKASEHIALEDYHYLTSACVHAPSLEEALRCFARYGGVISAALRAKVYKDEKYLRLQMAEVRPEQSSVACAIILNHLIRLVRLGWHDQVRPIEVCFPKDGGLVAAEIYDRLGTEVRFNTGEISLVFAVEDAGRPSQLAMPQLKNTYSSLLSEYERYLVREQRSILRMRFKVLDALANGEVSLALVANLLGKTERSMQRFLQRKGRTYREILNVLRQEKAIELLQSEGVSICDVAYALAFCDQSHFTNNFREWTGMTPRAFMINYNIKKNLFSPSVGLNPEMLSINQNNPS